MPRYRVLIPWTNDDGEHKPGDQVELSRDTPVETVEVDKLINYGIVEPATLTVDKDDAPEPKAATRKK
jgi:hypothetical protein